MDALGSQHLVLLLMGDIPQPPLDRWGWVLLCFPLSLSIPPHLQPLVTPCPLFSHCLIPEKGLILPWSQSWFTSTH